MLVSMMRNVGSGQLVAALPRIDDIEKVRWQGKKELLKDGVCPKFSTRTICRHQRHVWEVLRSAFLGVKRTYHSIGNSAPNVNAKRKVRAGSSNGKWREPLVFWYLIACNKSTGQKIASVTFWATDRQNPITPFPYKNGNSS